MLTISATIAFFERGSLMFSGYKAIQFSVQAGDSCGSMPILEFLVT